MTLFYSYYFSQKDDTMLRKIIQLADRHTVTIELLAKIADSEEVLLHEFYDSLVQYGFHISTEEVAAVHEKMHSEGRIIEQLKKLFAVYGCSPKDPQVGTIYNNIGLCFYYMGQPDEAIKNYRKSIQINISTYGKEHPSTAYIYNNVGAAYSETEHPEKAIPEHEHALKIYEAAYPDKLNLDFALTHADLE